MAEYGSYRLGSYLREFGPEMLLRTSITRLMRMLHFPNSIIEFADERKWIYVVEFLKRHYGDCIINYSESRDLKNLAAIEEDSPIWLFWWQGIEKAPELVKACVSSIERNAGNRSVIVIDRDNINELVRIDCRIMNRVISGQVSLTHFSDILRFSLLSQNGGIWMDATMYMFAPFPEFVSKCPYFSQKLGFGPGPWTDFFQGSGPGNPFTTSVMNILSQYNIEHDQILTYLLVDCAMRAVFEYSQDYSRLVMAPDDAGNDMFGLANSLDLPFSDQLWREMKVRPNFVSKLSYKVDHPLAVDGQLTFYGKIITEGALP